MIEVSLYSLLLLYIYVYIKEGRVSGVFFLCKICCICFYVYRMWYRLLKVFVKENWRLRKEVWKGKVLLLVFCLVVIRIFCLYVI